MNQLDLSKRLVLFHRSTKSEIRISNRYAWINGGLCRYKDVFHYARMSSATCLDLIYFCGLHQCIDIIPTITYTRQNGGIQYD